jgi:hypothetical protein
MEQVFVIIALVIFWIFRGVSGAQRRPPGQVPDEQGPFTRGGLDDAIEDAQQRALDALQRWEARQGLGKGADPGVGTTTTPTRREPLPRATPEHSPRVSMSRSTAVRERREAYADIAGMLDPQRMQRVGRREPQSRLGLRPDESRSAEPLASVPVEAQRSEPTRTAESAENSHRRDRADQARDRDRESSPGSRVEEPRAGRKPSGSSVAAALARLERLPMPARAIVYAEILGPPPSLRQV